MDPSVAGSSPVDRPPLRLMTTLEAIILGIIQGLTEFFPVSSSGHLELGQTLLGLTNLDQYIFFDLICHLGTLTALFLVFFDQIKSLIFSERSQLTQVIVGTLPLFPLVLILKPIKALFGQPQYLGFCFLLTATLLYLGQRFGRAQPAEVLEKRRWRDAAVIGLFQAVAILPGVSRSGATISAGRLLGWGPREAISFSFMLAIPAILGGVVLELSQIAFTSGAMPAVGWLPYVAGFLSSFGIGYLALLWLMQLAAKDKFIYFVWYCVIVGIATLWFFN